MNRQEDRGARRVTRRQAMIGAAALAASAALYRPAYHMAAGMMTSLQYEA